MNVANQLFLTRSTIEDYEDLCKLDVLGLEERENSEDPVFDRFKQQLTRSPEGWYETDLLFKPQDAALGTNKAASLGRLKNLINNKFKNNKELFQEYDEIIQNHMKLGYVEKVTEDPAGKAFYLPHRPVIRNNA